MLCGKNKSSQELTNQLHNIPNLPSVCSCNCVVLILNNNGNTATYIRSFDITTDLVSVGSGTALFVQDLSYRFEVLTVGDLVFRMGKFTDLAGDGTFEQDSFAVITRTN